jgi:hypothetical protein
MSVLNDALKRASEAQQEHDTVRIKFDRLPPMPAPAPAPASKPQPTSSSVPEPKREPTWGWAAESETKKGRSFAVPVIVIVLIAAGTYIGIRHFSKKPSAHGAAIVPVSHPVHAIAPASRPIATPRPAKVQTAAVATGAHERVSWPSLNVQAIFYSGAKSQAIVNRKTVYVGDIVDDRIRVAGISRNKVLFIAPDGSQKKLGLGE